MIYDLCEKGYPFQISMNISGLSDKVNEHTLAVEVLEATQIYYPGSYNNWFRPRGVVALRSIDPDHEFKFVRILIDRDNARTIEAIFSKELNHVDVLNAMVHIAFDYCHDIGHCIAAGFVSDGRYYGRSESIGIDCEGNE
ncbi:hypothetical protein PHG31p122 [Aeromonas phage 31]|uniref:Uncharacterized protein n=4 Tax=Biquartavirus TaxID=1912143 RepID=Q6U9H8_9CAUD|nr:hypothetical protein ST44RRORF124c [Aeromonas phage 44RR2.8t]YP_238851.1 hypothetical protein PHG31p122 [Aeromonas phage 31]APU00596.1 hypothetical protein [Aeromonas phage 44RR2.8t.2]APU01017.1 hypothetical protein [Aeromonas phage 31.2]APU02178.1 hypothetical protein [Aeromonas phage Riv-10]UYD59677.1 hypothetical protein JNMOADIG_00165 [Aeromonas phage avDM5]UYD60593.1 hypothetical protein NPHMPGLK_00258 [Aeromonas phage avDM2]